MHFRLPFEGGPTEALHEWAVAFGLNGPADKPKRAIPDFAVTALRVASKCV